jgi:hypothetical protein
MSKSPERSVFLVVLADGPALILTDDIRGPRDQALLIDMGLDPRRFAWEEGAVPPFTFYQSIDILLAEFGMAIDYDNA